MNRQIRRFGVGMMVLYLLLFAQLNRLQVFDAQKLVDDPNNTRPIVRDYGQRRGTITTADGTLVAFSEELDEGQFARQRLYPEGDLYGHITGFFSFNYGAEGLEKTYNDELAGKTTEQAFGSLEDLLVDRDNTGNLVLGLNHQLQVAARDALGEQNGSVVALEPATGNVLAMWSWPSYDPNLISAVDQETSRAAWVWHNALNPSPLIPKAYRETYFPGSTFKIVTASAALASGNVSPTSPVYPVVPSYTPPLTTSPLRNFGGSSCGGDLNNIIRVSCNSAIAQMAVEEIGPEALAEMAEAFGFNDRLPLDLPSVAESVFVTDYGPFNRTNTSEAGREYDVFDNTPAFAQSSIGQFETKATPLQMAMVVAAVGNNGRLMEPKVVTEILDVDGGDISTNGDELMKLVMAPDVAQKVREAMVGAVADGTGRRLQTPGWEVGSKTGTAQLGASVEATHAWVIVFAGQPGQPADIAIAVLVEADAALGQQTGGTAAAPIAKAVLDAFIALQAGS